MKKIIMIVLGFTAFITLYGCTAKEVINTYSEFEERGYVIVGLDDTFAPMGFRNNENELVGFDIDLAKAVFNYLGLEVRFQPIDWNSKELELKSGSIDMIWNGLSITEARKKEILFSLPYLANRQIILTKSGATIDTISDLVGKKLGVQISSAADQAVTENSISSQLGQLIKYDTYNQAILELDNNTIDGVVIDEIMGRYIMSQKEGVYQVASESFLEEFYGIGYRLESVELKGKIDEALQILSTRGVTTTISQNWFDEDIFLIS
jgi:polar amino acid transport system substrate-binding protein